MQTDPLLNSFSSLCRKKIMDLIALRDHSVDELKMKLKTYLLKQARIEAGQENSELAEEMSLEIWTLIDQVIDSSIAWAEEKNWIKEPQEFSLKVAGNLNDRKKGILYINQYLQQKGLPTVTANDEDELEKARALLQSKLRSSQYAKSADLENKLTRFLASRGFSSETIRKALHEELTSP